jgi:hypothetical protein
VKVTASSLSPRLFLPRRPLLATSVLLGSPAAALAHASDRGHVLLLPTGYYLLGGAVAVAVSFIVLALLPSRVPERLWRARLPLPRMDGETPRIATSLLSFAGFAVLVAAGLFGSRDPLSNPLPLVVWTLLWAGLVLVQGLLGDVWRWLDPWYGIWRMVAGLRGRRLRPWRLPARLGCWPAVALLAAFAWFELIDPAPDDPARLTVAAGAYWLFTFACMLAFGHRHWGRRGEFLTLCFSLVARFGVVGRSRGRLVLRLPGAGLSDAAPLSLSSTAFVLLALSSVSFDGLSKTFFWLGFAGVNPLDYPGRTALIPVGTLGLFLTFLLLAGAFALALWLGQRLAGAQVPLARAAGLLVWSIVPISLAYHGAHYLTALLVDGQYALIALSDPFARGWNLFGTAGMHVHAGVVAGAQSAWWLWNAQAFAIVAGHVLAVLVAHAQAGRLYGDDRHAVVAQLPLTVLMVAYTVFGLWLLATPAVG